MKKKYFINMTLEKATTEDNINTIEKEYIFSIPSDFKEFLKNSNGGEGSVGENSYLSIFPIEDIQEINSEYEINSYLPHLIMFGTNRGGTGYAFDNKGTFFELDLSDLNEENLIKCGTSWEYFLEYLWDY